MRAGPGYFEKEKESVEALIVVVHDFAQERGDGIRAIRDAVFSPRDVVEKRTPERDVRTGTEPHGRPSFASLIHIAIRSKSIIVPAFCKRRRKQVSLFLGSCLIPRNDFVPMENRP